MFSMWCPYKKGKKIIPPRDDSGYSIAITIKVQQSQLVTLVSTIIIYYYYIYCSGDQT